MSQRHAPAIWPVVVLLAACSGPLAPTATAPPLQAPSPTTQATGTGPSSATPEPPFITASPVPETTPTPTASAGIASPTASPVPLLSVASADGVVTVDVFDAGAVPAGTTISVGTQPADQSPPELVDAGVSRPCYTLEPEGTTFSRPVKVTMTRPRDHYGDANTLPYLALATRTAEGAWQWLSDTAMWLTEETMAISGWTDHFSCLYEWSDRTDVIINPGAPRTDRVGETFTRTIELRSKDERAHKLNFTDVEFINSWEDVIAVGPDKAGTPAEPKLILDRDWTCVGMGFYDVLLRATINDFGSPDNPFWTNLGLPETRSLLYIELPGLCTSEQGIVDRACVRVHHDPLGEFVSYLEFLLWLFGGYDVDYVEVTLQGANDDMAARLDLDGDHFAGDLGLHTAGPKQLQQVLLHTLDGNTIDVTDEVRQELGDIVVQFPDENTVGDCD